MYGFLSKILWRHSKADVRSDLCVPPQKYVTLELDLCAPERTTHDTKRAQGKEMIERHMRGLVHRKKVPR